MVGVAGQSGTVGSTVGSTGGSTVGDRNREATTPLSRKLIEGDGN
jgi:hypothetical protein